MKRRRQQPERALQVAVVGHLKARGVPGLVFWHTPNQGRRDIRYAANLKRMGVKAGVSDLILLHQGRMYSLELKADKNQRMTDAQCDFMSSVNAAGGFSWCAIGLDGALQALTAWGLIK